MKKGLLSIALFLICATVSMGQTVTRTYTPPSSTSIDGVGNYGTALPSVSFSQGDFTNGCRISDVDVIISWAKTSGTCSTPTNGSSFHVETSFRIDGPTNNEILAVPGTWFGGVSTSSVITTFNQGSVIPSSTPITGTFGPNNGNLNNYNGTLPYGNWNLAAGDNAAGDPLCLVSYSVRITTSADNIAPVYTSAPSNITVNATTGVCGAIVTWPTVTATDNCTPFVSQTGGLPSGSVFPVGVSTVNYQASDSYSNVNNHSFTVTVIDTQIPTIACPADITVNAPFGNCTANVNFTTPTGGDNCGWAVTQIGGPPSGGVFPLGNTTVTFRATDDSGNTADCSFTVTVLDIEDPSISCPANISVNAPGGSCTANVTFAASVASDNCPGVTFTQTGGLPSGSNFPLGNTTVTFLAIDASGNTTPCSFMVTVLDVEGPSISCPADITATALTGNCTANISFATPSAGDNCPGATVSQIGGLASGAAFPVGSSIVTFRATDPSGNFTDCSFTVTVLDIEVPTISCPTNITVNAPIGSCSATVNFTTPTAGDNCPAATVAQIAGLASGAVFPVGVSTVVFRATDASANTADCSFTVTVLDIEDPVITCPADINVVSTTSACGAIVTYTTPVGTDNCAGVTTALDAGLLSGATFPSGTTTVTYLTTDASGNEASCSFDVTVDPVANGTISLAPTPICVGDDVTLTFNFTSGTPPFNITVSDGINSFSVTGVVDGDTYIIEPPTTVTYSYTSIEDATGCVRMVDFDGSADVVSTPLPNVSFTGLDLVYCESEAIVTLTGSQSGGSFFGTGVTDFGGGSGSFNPTAAGATGPYDVTYTFTDINNCTDTDVQSVLINEQPIADAGSGGDECDIDFTFSAAPPTVGIGTWTIVSGPGTPLFSNVNGATSAVQVPSPTGSATYVFQWTVVNGECSDSEQITVNFYETPVANPGFAGTECDFDFVLGAVPSVGNGTWTATGPGTATFFPDANTPNAIATVDAYGTYAFTWTEDNNNCIDDASIFVVFDEQSMSDAGTGGDECDFDFVFNATSSVGGGQWTASGPGAATYVADSNPTTTVTVSNYGTYIFTWTETNGSCSSVDQVTVNFYEQPIADAGNGGDECDSDFTFSAVPSIGTGLWTQTSGPGTATFADDTDATTDVSISAGGTYVFTWTETNGTCTDSRSVLVNFFAQPAANAGSGGDECDLDFTFSAIASAGTGTWTSVGSGTASFANANNPTTDVGVSLYGTYVFTWTEVDGTCSDAASISVNFYEQPVANAGSGGDECDLDFIFSAVATTGVGTWSEISGPGTALYSNMNSVTSDVQVTAYGTYVFQWEEINGSCSDADQITVNFYNPPMAVFSSITNPSDCGLADGIVTAIGTGGLAPYSLEWSNGSTDATIGGLEAGPYIVTVTDALGCTDVSSVSLNEPSASVIFLTNSDSDNTICQGESVTFTATGAFQYQYYIDGVLVSTENPFITNTLQDGQIISVAGTDLNFCTYTTPGIVFTVNDVPVIVETIVDPTVCATSDGSISLSVTGGVPDYSTLWASGQTMLDISGISAGPYFVTVTDQNGCSTNGAYALNDPGASVVTLTSSEDPDNEICSGESITFTASGSLNYQFFVDGQFVSNINPYITSTLTDGQLVVATGTDISNCTATSNFIYSTVNSSPAIGLTSNVFGNTICVGQSISFFATGGQMYEFFVDGLSQGLGSPSSVFVSSTLTSGQVVTVLVSDGNQCEVLSSGITVTVNASPSVSISNIVHPSDCSAIDGEATALATGGTPGYTYTWNSGFVGATESGLSAGSYFVEVVDAVGCTATTSASLSDVGSTPVAITTDLSTDTLCGGTTITFSATNGFANYAFYVNGQLASIQNPYLTDSLVNGDIVAVTATDTMSCTSTADPFQFTVLPEIQIGITSLVNPSVCGASDGEASSLVIGGVPPYTILWTDGQVTSSVTGLEAGAYSVTVTDANGCQATASGSLSDLGGFSVSLAASPANAVICEGTEIEFTAFGAISYEFYIDGILAGNANPFVTSSLTDGQTVTAVGMDLSNCTATSLGLTYQVDPVVQASLALLPNEACSDQDTVMLAGGLPLGGEYTVVYFGTPVTGDLFFPNLAETGTANVEYTYTTLSGCSSTITDQYMVYETPVTDAGLGGDECDFDFVFSAVPSVGIGTWTYAGPGTATFSPDANDPAATVTVDLSGAYQFTWSEDNNGCTDSETITVVFNTLPVVSFAGLAATYCIDQTTPVPLTGTPAGGDFSGLGISSNSFVPSIAGVGTIFITYTYTDGNGCTDSETQTVDVNGLPNVSFSGMSAAYCQDDATAYILAGSPFGGTFVGSGISGDDFTPEDAGFGDHTITYTYTDPFGCTSFEDQDVTINELPVVTVSGLAASYCEDALDAALVGSPTGGTFSGTGITGNSFSPLSAGVGVHTLTYTYTDGNGCTNSIDLDVTIDPLPTPVISPSGISEICIGDDITLDAGTGYSNYTWSNAQNGQTNTVSASASYNVTVTTSQGCVATSASVQVLLNQLPIVDLGNDTTICTAATLVLDAGHAGSDYVWSTSEISQTISVTTTGVSTVEVTDQNGCVGTDNITVVVSNLLDPVIVSNGPLTFCVGDSVTLSVDVYQQYQWSTSETGQTATLTTPGIVEVVVWDEFGCNGTDEVVVSFLQLPNAVILPSTEQAICSGDSVELSVNGTFGSYNWNPGTGNTSSIFVSEGGSYTVTVEDPNNGCFATSASVLVTVNTTVLPTIVADGDIEFCKGESVGLSVVPGPYNSVLWTSNSSTPSIVVIEDGCYGVTVIDANGCINSALLADPFCVTVWDAQPLAIQYGDSLVVTNGPFNEYQWYFNGVQIVGATGEVHIATANGNYYVEAVDDNGCEGTSFNLEVTIIGIADLELLYDINLYPNPTNGLVTLKVDFGKRVDATVSITDVTGRQIIMPESVRGVSNIKRTFDLEQLANGIYYLKLITEDGSVVKSMIRN